MSYARRFIDVEFSGGTAGTITFNQRGKFALRTSARILHAGGVNLSELQLELRGISLAHISALSTYGTLIHPNYGYKVKVDAGDDENGMSTVFTGNIQQAWGDMRAMPDVPFHVLATAGGAAAVDRATPSSYQGSTDVTTMLQQLAGKAGLTFRNFGVSGVKLADPYHWGSSGKQIREIIQAAGIDGIIANDTLSIWPKSGGADGTLEVNPKTGMRDYPSFTEYGIQTRVEFKRAVEYRSIMNVTSDLKPANGPWRIIRIDYDLQANMPRGNWFVVLDGAKLDTPVEQLP